MRSLLPVYRPDAQVIYQNACVTSHTLNHDSVAVIVRAGRSRWQVANETTPSRPRVTTYSTWSG